MLDATTLDMQDSDQDSEASADKARGPASKRPTSLNSARMPRDWKMVLTPMSSLTVSLLGREIEMIG